MEVQLSSSFVEVQVWDNQR